MASSSLSKRLTFQELMAMSPLGDDKDTKDESMRLMSHRAAWLPGSDLPSLKATVGPGNTMRAIPVAAYGAHVYTQSALAACRLMKHLAEKGKQSKNMGLHSIHGTFTLRGQTDRPFIYTTTPLSLTYSFSTALVTARQPTSASSNSAGDNYPLSDSTTPLGPICFQALVSFKTPDQSPVEVQEESVQQRFHYILSSRKPEEWPPSPAIDISGLIKDFPEVADTVGTFPAVEMRKVDMTGYNKDKPVHERKELILYKLIAPLPEEADGNEHVLVHVYECDRNGLLMLGNHLGYGEKLGNVATLAWTYTVHGSAAGSRIEGDGWWVQEVAFEKAGGGRGVLVSKMWSPDGRHVGTEYQDGVVRPLPGGKL